MDKAECRFRVHNSELDLFGSSGALDFLSPVFLYGREHQGPVDRIAGLYPRGVVENGAGIDCISKRSFEIRILSLEILESHA